MQLLASETVFVTYACHINTTENSCQPIAHSHNFRNARKDATVNLTIITLPGDLNCSANSFQLFSYGVEAKTLLGIVGQLCFLPIIAYQYVYSFQSQIIFENPCISLLTILHVMQEKCVMLNINNDQIYMYKQYSSPPLSGIKKQHSMSNNQNTGSRRGVCLVSLRRSLILSRVTWAIVIHLGLLGYLQWNLAMESQNSFLGRLLLINASKGTTSSSILSQNPL